MLLKRMNSSNMNRDKGTKRLVLSKEMLQSRMSLLEEEGDPEGDGESDDAFPLRPEKRARPRGFVLHEPRILGLVFTPV